MRRVAVKEQARQSRTRFDLRVQSQLKDLMDSLSFQQLALDLVKSVKALQAYTLEPYGDKDLEHHLALVTSIVSLGFKVPTNISVSIA